MRNLLIHAVGSGSNGRVGCGAGRHLLRTKRGGGSPFRRLALFDIGGVKTCFTNDPVIGVRAAGQDADTGVEREIFALFD